MSQYASLLLAMCQYECATSCCSCALCGSLLVWSSACRSSCARRARACCSRCCSSNSDCMAASNRFFKIWIIFESWFCSKGRIKYIIDKQKSNHCRKLCIQAAFSQKLRIIILSKYEVRSAWIRCNFDVFNACYSNDTYFIIFYILVSSQRSACACRAVVAVDRSCRVRLRSAV